VVSDPTILEVVAFPQEMRAEVESLDEQWMPFFARLEGPVRLISRTERFNLRVPQQALETRARPLDVRAKAFSPLAEVVRTWDDARTPAQIDAILEQIPPQLAREVLLAFESVGGIGLEGWQRTMDKLGRPLWRRRWLKAYRQMYDMLITQVALRGLHHYMVAWLPDGMRADDMVASVEHVFDTGAQRADLPALLPGMYTEFPDHLAPQESHLPLFALLTSYDFKGTWTIATLHRVLGMDLDLALSIDIGLVSRTKAEMMADFTINNRQTQLRSGSGPRDVRAERQLKAAYDLQDVLDTEALHDVRMVLALQGRDLEELNANVRKVETAAGATLKLMRPIGGQGPLVKFFGTTPTGQITALTRPRRQRSMAVTQYIPFGLRKPDRTDGLMWMLQGDTPIMFDPFADRRAAHAIVLGKTGSGKTFAINCWAMRLLALGHQIVMYEPQGHSRRLIEAVGRGGARYVLDMCQRVNVLDIIATRDESGNAPSIATQIDHVITQLSVLLGTNVPTAEGKTAFRPRIWESIEQGLLDLALQRVYRDLDLEALGPGQTPIIADLCDALSEQGGAEAKRLAYEMTLRLVQGSRGTTFNQRTTIDWDFTHDATAYDFSGVPEGTVRTFYYGQAFGALNRFVRSPIRDRRRTTVAIIDEFAYMAQVPSLASFAAMASKTWRTFNAHLWTLDQDAHTYIGTENGNPDPAMLSVFINAPIKVMLKQDAADAARLGHKIEGLHDAHVNQIKRQGRGELVLVWEGDGVGARHNEVFVGRVEPNDDELRAFAGT
jgi:hypothetical protein